MTPGADEVADAKGVRVPGWAVSAIGLATALVLAGVTIGKQLQTIATNQRDQNYRLCRIEAAVRLQPWYTCSPRGGDDQATATGARRELEP